MKRIIWQRSLFYFILFVVLRTITHLVRYGFFDKQINTAYFFGQFVAEGLVFAIILFLVWVIIFCLMILWFKQGKAIPATYLGLIVIGGLSNIIDRLWYGGVIDYIYIGIFPVFNLSDVCIVIGALGIIFAYWRQPLT